MAFVLAMIVAAPAGAYTYTYDKLTYMTFSGSVQIPGATLDPGTYRFRLANPETSRNVLQVLSQDGAIVYAMFHTIPDSRVNVTEEAMVTYREMPAGVPPAIRSLFYGGETRGYEFVYGPAAPHAIARPLFQPEITYTAMPAAMPEAVAEPEPEPADVAPAETPAEPIAMDLPHTATAMPWVGLGGVFALATALGMGLFRR
jgi:hypothetical protein